MDPSSVLRVMVVEDTHDIADAMVLLLQLWGYQTAVVYDGEQALATAKSFHPDAVLLDIGLPRMDGFELASQLRRLPGLTKTLLVAITSYGRESDIQRGKEVGIDLHFLKPVDPSEVQKVLSKLEKSGHGWV
jgi:CheY-like chemotaxis protein